MKKITIVVLVALMLLTAALPASATVKVSSVEIRGSVVNASTTANAVWDRDTFAGFFYDLKNDLGKERMTANITAGNLLDEGNLTYSTEGETKALPVVEKQYSGNAQNAIDKGLEQFDTGDMSAVNGSYKIIGWMAEKYIAINGKDNKLSKLLVEHGASATDKKTLTVGESWEIGAGYTLTANSIDAKASPRQVWLTLSKDGVKKDDKVITAGTNEAKPIYTYVEKSLCGETDVPVFVTYVDSVFAGATTDMVQLRYTWLISPTCTEVKNGDVFGSLKVTSTSPIKLQNSDNALTLSPDTTVNVMGDIKFKVADDPDYVRYYPFVLRTANGIYEVRGAVWNATDPAQVNAVWTRDTFAGFFYDLKNDLGKERMTANVTAGNLLDEGNLTYSTEGETKALPVVEKQYSGNAQNAIDKGLEQFDNGDMSAVNGSYKIVGWMAEKYIAINGKDNKLSKLLVEHGASATDKKTLTVGESWEIGGGYTLTANSIDAKASPRQVWLTLSKDGVKKDDKVITAGTNEAKPIYTYVEKSLCAETDVPVFVTYVDSVFAGATTDMVQLRYTWLISPTCTEIKNGDVFGSLKVTSTSPIKLQNSDNALTLSPDTTVNVMGEIKLKVADDPANVRYYPFVEYEITDGTITPTPTVSVVATTPAKTPNQTTPATTTVAGGEAGTTTPAATTAAAKPTQTEPGFEGIFAIAGLLAVAFLVLRQRK